MSIVNLQKHGNLREDLENVTCDAEVHVCAIFCGEEVDKSCTHQHKAEQSKFDDHVSLIRDTQKRLRDDEIETRLKQNKEVKMQREKKSISSNEEEVFSKSFDQKTSEFTIWDNSDKDKSFFFVKKNEFGRP